jgi:hypothetical protein
LERINEPAFSGSRLKSVVIPSYVVILRQSSFHAYKALESVTFERSSLLGKKELEVHKVQAMWQQIGNQRQGGECVFSSQLGVSQEEVQKNPQLGTTQ